MRAKSIADYNAGRVFTDLTRDTYDKVSASFMMNEASGIAIVSHDEVLSIGSGFHSYVALQFVKGSVSADGLSVNGTLQIMQVVPLNGAARTEVLASKPLTLPLRKLVSMSLTDAKDMSLQAEVRMEGVKDTSTLSVSKYAPPRKHRIFGVLVGGGKDAPFYRPSGTSFDTIVTEVSAYRLSKSK